jgi:ribosome-binding protein aMBF1 (putative translation factor)
MITKPISGIQPAVIRWARQSAGLSVVEVAAKLKRPVEDVKAWESGSSAVCVQTPPPLEHLLYPDSVGYRQTLPVLEGGV